MEINFKELAVGSTAFFMPWKHIVIADEVIEIHHGENTLYEFKHIQGRYKAFASTSELETAFGLLKPGERK